MKTADLHKLKQLIEKLHQMHQISFGEQRRICDMLIDELDLVDVLLWLDTLLRVSESAQGTSCPHTPCSSTLITNPSD